MSRQTAAVASSSATPASVAVPHLHTMDEILVMAVQCGGSTGKIHQLLQPALDRLRAKDKGKGQEVLLTAAQGGKDPLALIDSQQSSLAYAYILAARLVNAKHDPAIQLELVPYIDAFTNTCSPEQIIMAGEQVTEIGNAIARIASSEAVDPLWGLNTLERLLHKLVSPGSATNLTTLHVLVAQQYQRVQQPDVAIERLFKHPIQDADRRISPLRGHHAIEYFYLAGLAFMQAKQLDSAEYMLERCVAAPAKSVHDKQSLAAKRLILLQLQRDGRVKPLPHHCSGVIARNYQRFASAYLQFADRFSSADRNVTEHELGLIIEKYQETFTADGTLAQISSLLPLHRGYRIRALGSTFTKLRISDLVQLLQLRAPEEDQPAAEARVQSEVESLISSKRLAATMSPSSPSPILTFHTPDIGDGEDDDNADPFSSLSSASVLSKQMAQMKEWTVFLQDKEREMARSKPFVQKMQNGLGHGRGGPGGGWLRGGGGGGGSGGGGAGGGGGGGGGGVSLDDFEDNVFA